MSQTKPHDPERLTRFAFGDLAPGERTELERHLETCTPCQEFVSFVREFNAGLRDAKPTSPYADEPCPDASLIVALGEESLDEMTAQHVRAHMIFCESCREAYYALRHLDQMSWWQKLADQVRDRVIDLTQRYDPGVLMGPIRIVAEGPALPTRGERTTETRSIVLELSVDPNTYSIELGYTPESSVSCDIAGLKTPRKIPLEVSVRSEEGEEVLATKTDEQGNLRFLLKRDDVPSGICILACTLEGSVQHLPFLVREKPGAS